MSIDQIIRKVPFIVIMALIAIFVTRVISGGGQDPIYKPVAIDASRLAQMPVDRLLINIDKHHWHLMEESFGNDMAFNNLLTSFGLTNGMEKLLEAPFAENAITGIITKVNPLSASDFPPHEFEVELQNLLSPGNKLVMDIITKFDELTLQYLIESLSFNGEIDIIPDDPIIVDPQVYNFPPLITTPCNPGQANFAFIKLQHRQKPGARIIPPQRLSDPQLGEIIQVPTDYYGTQAFMQPKFNTFQLGDGSYYDPGYIISSEDAINNGLDVIFTYVTDADGVLEVNSGGTLISYPTAFFADSRSHNLVVLSQHNDYLTYPARPTDVRLFEPHAVKAIGNYLYVLERRPTPSILILEFLINANNDFELLTRGRTTFGIDLTGVADITGFEGNGTENYLYIAKAYEGSITRIVLDPATGFEKIGSHPPYAMSHYIHLATGKTEKIGHITRLESSQKNATNGRNTLMVIEKGKYALALSTIANTAVPVLRLNYSNVFPIGTDLINVAYNVGTQSFYISDLTKSKVHVFSGDGEYLGSGGRYGKQPTDMELYYPNALSSNTFNGSASEIIVANKWSYITGFKRLFPLAEIGNMEVKELASFDIHQINQNRLFFCYTLTAGIGVDEILLKLNGSTIKTINGTNSSFPPNAYNHHFLTTQLGSNLHTGWNTFEIQLTATNPLDNNAYQKIKSIDFYYIPSIITTDFTISDQAPADLVHNAIDNPLYIYKSIFVPGADNPAGIQLRIENGKTIFMSQCTLSVSKNTHLIAQNEDFAFECISNLELVMNNSVPKSFQNCSFIDAVPISPKNMVTARGDYYGVPFPTTATKSPLEFIDCRFTDYETLTLPLWIIGCRSTLVGTDFVKVNPGNSDPNITAMMANALAVVDIQDGQFVHNGVGIDASQASLLVKNTLFENNQIGIHTFDTHSAIAKAQFKNNHAGIMDLNGTIDISGSSDNLFENNTNAIIFSNLLIGAKGENQFIENHIDLNFMMPDVPTQASQPLDMICNYWERGNGTAIGQPVLKFTSSPTNPANCCLPKFIYKPYLIRSGANFVCKGTNKTANTVAVRSDTSVFHKPYLAVSKAITRQEFQQSRQHIIDLNGSSQAGALGHYPDREDTIKSFQQALAKNLSFAFLLQKNYLAYDTMQFHQDTALYHDLVDFDDGYIINTTEPSYSVFQEITKDRLAFLAFFIGTHGTIQEGSAEDNQERSIESSYAPRIFNIFPNPLATTTTLQITLPHHNYYSLEVYHVSGKLVSRVFSYKEHDSGLYDIPIDLSDQENGIYFGVIFDAAGSFVKQWKMVKQ